MCVIVPTMPTPSSVAVLAPGTEKFCVAVGWRATAHQIGETDRALDRMLSDRIQFRDRRHFRRALQVLVRKLPRWRHEGKHAGMIAEMFSQCCNSQQIKCTRY